MQLVAAPDALHTGQYMHLLSWPRGELPCIGFTSHVNMHMWVLIAQLLYVACIGMVTSGPAPSGSVHIFMARLALPAQRSSVK
jgi:hypothetical protein